MKFLVSGGHIYTHLSSFSHAYACAINFLGLYASFALSHRATSCIIKRENARGETHDLYHVSVILYVTAKRMQKISGILNVRILTIF